tara:strand:+ start:1218 stop:5690 length:4473 start_codon:yes stop_codon:yes gene_type:complete
MTTNNEQTDTISFRCIDFNVSSFKQEDFIITIYGIDENRKTYCVKIDDFKPFFYIKVGHNWTDTDVSEYFDFIRETYKSDYSLLKTLKNDLEEVQLVKHKTLYNFDANKKHNFIKVTCKNMSLVYKFKSLFYDKEKQRLNKGVEFNGTFTQIYEVMIPPMLRFFHIQDISPSGWVEISNYDLVEDDETETKVDIEVKANYRDIISLPEKETIVPYKICSFDIEASSSHGDFPTAIKNYKKVAYDILDYIQLNDDEVSEYGMEKMLYYLLKSVFGFADDISIDNCYVKNKEYKVKDFEKDFKLFIQDQVSLNDEDASIVAGNTLDDYMGAFDGNDEIGGFEQSKVDICENDGEVKSQRKSKLKNKSTNKTDIESILNDSNYDNQTKMGYLTISLNKSFPHLEGDYVTFIGSTFVSYGDENSHLNNCICLGETTNHDETTQVIECYDTEREVLLAWTDLIQQEDPDIIVGYNIFGFDYPFMFNRAKENNCVEEFMNLSRKNDTFLEDEEIKLSQTKIVLASGAYDLKYPPMDGRLQIDVFTYMRKEFILPSYKLDYVSSYLISDKVSKYENNDDTNCCSVYTKNTKGISMNCFVHFEILNHSNELYQNGKKFKVIDINDSGFIMEGHLEDVDKQTIQWGLAKDDVTPQDIFRMTNEGPNEKGIIAKYCIQDCNLVHQIFQKIDIMTTYIEMSKICSVPISFLMLRGQGVKLTSYVAKKCREKDTLMPLISIGNASDLYEGAIVLDPKTGLYLDNPVACVDYSSLYPSSIISENISHDSKVWTKEYELDGNIARYKNGNEKITGIVDKTGKFKYDNLPGYKYVDIKYDTFSFKRLGGTSSKLSKVLTGYKICRYAQFPNHEKAILPSILQELLSARKATKKQMGKESDPFMKNILDKRQLSIKVTANSLYGQCGAKTSTFYEMDIAASTTATGRKLLIYAKDMIESVYNNVNIDTKHGNMKINAEYIYGDSVANYTPIYINVNGILEIIQIDELGKKYGKNNWKQCVEPGKQTKEYIDLTDKNIYTWTENSWTHLKTIIRHKLASEKKMMRILTHTGCVDVTDDHSLIRSNGVEISPKECAVGTELLHHTCKDNLINDISNMCEVKLEFDLSVTSNHIRMAKYIHHKYNVDDTNYVLVAHDSNDGFILSTKCPGTRDHKIKKIMTLEDYDDYVYDLTTDNHHFAAGIGNMIVHNTDSVFFTFNLKDPTTNKDVRGQKALEVTIDLAKEAGELATKFLKAPHDLEYEKTFMPFCLISKKRYVGMLYEEDPHKCKRKSMGIVLKRRDNAPIVKDVYGGIIDILMKEKNIKKSIDFLDNMLRQIVNEEIGMDKLIISKSLRSFYKCPQQIAHKVLADRIGVREPGNKPRAGDRIPYVYIYSKNKKELQGNKIEHPLYINEKKLKIDYGFYITNQIMKPVIQIYSLVLFDMPQFQKKTKMFKQKIKTLMENSTDQEKTLRKIQSLKDKEVESLLFKKYITINNNKAQNNRMITDFFG